ncbi:hypothetical protein DRN58_08050 [Thermococci archaeon]|nr:MAG: hypothetical protein DRN58_08050 [Thermococci archaeon]
MKRMMSVILAVVIATPLAAGTFVGIGGRGPLNLFTPNTVAWRFGRFVKGIMIEPSLTFNYTKTANRFPTDSSDVSNFNMGFDLLGIYPFFKVRDFDVHALIGLGFGFGNSKTTSKFSATEGDYTKTSTFNFGLDYGGGMQVFLTRTISVGVDAISGFSYSKSSSKSKTGTVTTDLGNSGTLNFGLDNTVFRFMLFFGR